MPARPTKLTPEFIKQMAQAVRLGLTQKSACAAYGVAEETVTRWVQQGREGKGNALHRQLYQEVTRAKDEGQLRLAALISKAADQDWKAAAWIMERRHSEDWANTQRLALRDETARDEVRREVFEEVRRHLGDEQYAKFVEAVAANGNPKK